MTATNTNTDYWNKILEKPNAKYRELFSREEQYLKTHIQKDAKVLEIGFGNGRNIESITSLAQDITGIEINEDAVQKAKLKFNSTPNVTVLCASAFEIPFPNKSFDVAILMLTLVNFEGKKTDALNEMRRVIKDDGRLILSVYADDALEVRMQQYEEISLLAEKVSDSKVVFPNIDEANVSEQFSVQDIEKLANDVNMKVVNLEKVSGIAYIFELTHKG